jgi:hypothetical protein
MPRARFVSLIAAACAISSFACDPSAPPARPRGAAAVPSASSPPVAPARKAPVEFMTIRTLGRQIVYLCDGSGSMLTAFDELRDAIARSIDGLSPDQSFTIIFFRDDQFVAFSPRVVPATPANRRRARQFLYDTNCYSSADPPPGIRATFAAGADTIFFLTNGDFPNNEVVREECLRLNRDRRAAVHTIAYVDNEPGYRQFLAQLAGEHGGQYAFVETPPGR